MTEEQARELLRVESHPLLEKASRMLANGESLFRVRALLEGEFEPSTCLAVLDLLACRVRYREKFERSHRWLLARQAAEQATGSRLARWRAGELARATGASSIIELGCGLGGDTVYLSRHFEVTAYERTLPRALLAEANLTRLGGEKPFRVIHEERACSSLKGELLFVDPARRDSGRLHSPEAWHPPLSEVLACVEQGRFKAVAVKCAPGMKDAALERIPCGYRLDFLALGDQLKESFLLLGAETGRRRRAVIFADGEAEPAVVAGEGRSIPVSLPRSGNFLHNPNPAILRARALDTLARELQASIVHPRIGYLTGPTPAPPLLAASFRIVETFPLDWTALKKAVRGLSWSEYEYLGRGVPFSQDDVRRKLPKLPRREEPLRGSVIIYRDEAGYRAVLAERHAPEGKPRAVGKGTA